MAEPLTFAQVAENIGLGSDTSRQASIEQKIAAARAWVESHTGHILVQRTFTEYHRTFGSYIEITKRPIVEVSAINYFDTDGVAQTYEPFVAMTSVYPARVYPEYNGAWPSIRTNMPVSITFTAGYDAGDEPQELIQAMHMLVAHWFGFIEAGSERPVSEVPFGVEALCAPYRPLVA